MKKISFWVGLTLTLSLLWPLLAAPYFSHHDNVQLIRLYEIDKCIKDLQLPCRWVPDLGGLYGYPLFNYYAPLPYYIGEICYLVTKSLIISAKIMFGLAFIFSYIFMYLVASKLWGEKGGALSGIFYSFAPYHSVDFYVRGAMGELWAIMIFPFVFWALLRLREKLTTSNILLLSLSIASLVLSHNLSTMIFMPAVTLFLIFFYLERRNSLFLVFSLLGILLGLMLSMFYFLPSYLEKDLVHVETTIEGYFSHTEHFKGLRKLFLERSWGYGSSVREVPGGPRDNLSFQVGVVHCLGWLIALFSAFYLWREKRWVSIFILLSSLTIVGSVFMIHPRSYWVWNLIPQLQYLQFPWRFLEIIIFFISLIVGSLLLLPLKERVKSIMWVILVLLVVTLNFNYFRPQTFYSIMDKDVLTGVMWDSQIKRSIFDYLPKSAKAPPAELATTRYEILSGQGQISNFKEGSDWMKFNANIKIPLTFRWSQYYFPDYKVFIDQQQININYKNDLGLITFNIPAGSHNVYAKLFNTSIRYVANNISLVGFLVLLILFLKSYTVNNFK